MNGARALTLLVVADVFLAFSTIGAELFFQWTMPGNLKDYLNSQEWLPTSLWGAGVFVFWAGSVACALAAWISLLNRWWFARRLYVAAWSSWLLLTLLSGPSVLNPLGATLTTLNAVVGGMILGLVYFSSLSRQFERPAVVVPAGSHATA